MYQFNNNKTNSINNQIFYHKNKMRWYQILFISLISITSLIFFIINLLYIGKSLSTDYLQPENSIFFRYSVYPALITPLVGFSLGVGTIAIQITTKNDLSGPTTLGFTPTITLAIAISAVSTAEYIPNLLIRYLIGLALCSILILVNFILTKGKINNNGFKPILIAFAIGSIAVAINVILVTHSPNTVGRWASYLNVSSSNGVNVTQFGFSVFLLIIPTLIIMFLWKKIDIMKRDLMLARSLGIKVDLIYWVVAFCLVIITITAALSLGLIVFFGVVISIIVTRIFKHTNALLQMLITGLLGTMILNFGSWISEIQLGGIQIIIAIISLPVFIYILKRRKINQGV
ncbi:iron ABC transporter permease [Ureaplasma sp. ES3154-GEN]|uniref:iron ABC transporter permease n=1 Tax=Ureaplasma sp. ES3154-GEN TaxID=2984844 RepID=UPI0021E8DF33|nr:iron ABC transporter permease [Ureaplasma sp. ES3154-GEN]MCV3743635.1 iron ABC transporter permease [Ureaplasma sp. ES3154-GEN]